MTRLKLAAAAFAIISLAACETAIQTTSGADYLARYNDSHAAYAGGSSDVDADVRRIASIEPTLEFPARIGLARLKHGQLTTLPVDEAQIWQAAAEELGPLYGEFVPVSPLIAAMVAEPRTDGMGQAAAVMANIRRGAARQHLDYVLAYEVGSSSRKKANVLALADLTVIGMFVLPSRTVEVEASASALMLDVRTGYPYATLTAHAEKTGVSRAVSEWSTSLDFADTAEERAVANLAGDFEEAMEELARRSLEMPAARTPVSTEPAISPMAKALGGS